MQVTIDFLQKFAASRNDVRDWLQAAFCFDGDAAATNGHALVVLSDGAASLPSDAKSWEVMKTHLPRMHLLKERWQALPPAGWLPFSAIERPVNPKKETCHQCRGAKFVTPAPCLDCDGDGSFWHGDYTYSCKACDGDGEAVSPCGEIAEGAEPCGVCDGRGWNFEDHFLACKVPGMPDGFGVQELYAEKLAGVEGLEFLYSAAPGGSDCLYLRFLGGWGVLMPCRIDKAKMVERAKTS